MIDDGGGDGDGDGDDDDNDNDDDDGGDCCSWSSLVCWDYGAQHEMVETLVELATSKRSPWLQNHDWSSEAQSLREIDIRTPWIVNSAFVCSHFKSLSLVDKCVSSQRSQQLTRVNLSSFYVRLDQIFCLPTVNKQ